MAAKHVLEDGVCRKIGTGAYTSVLEDVWIPSEIARPVRPGHLNFDPDLKVHHLINYENFLSEVIHAGNIPQI